MARVLLLDLGNVLVGFDHGRTLAALEEATGVAAGTLRPHVFGPLEREFDLGRMDAPAFFRAVETEASLPRLSDDMWIPAWRDIFVRDDAALALLDRIAPDVVAVLVSNTNALHWEGVLRVAPELPRLLPRRALSFEIGVAKPDPKHFEAALALAGASPREAVFADDRGEMVEAARALGIDAFAVNRPDDLEEGLRTRDSSPRERVHREYSLKVKRAAMRACVLVAPLIAVLLLAGSGCGGRDEAAGPAGASLNHSKKSSSSSSSSLPFISLSFDEALAKARSEKKLVFVDVTADWCSWCTKMDDDVFADERVRAALLEFVPVKVDADRGGGRAVANRYRVGGLPSYLVLNGDGIVVGRFGGYMPVEPFLRSLRRASGGRG